MEEVEGERREGGGRGEGRGKRGPTVEDGRTGSCACPHGLVT